MSDSEAVEALSREFQEYSARLNACRTFQEPEPSSQAPVLAAFFSGLRRLANRLATRWYVAPIVEQQQRFCSEVTGTFDRMAGIAVRQQQEIAALQSRITAIVEQQAQQQAAAEQQREQMAEQLAALSRQVNLPQDGPFTITLDYPVQAQPRYGYGKPPHAGLYEIIARKRERYRQHLTTLLKYRDGLAAIPLESEDESPCEPAWHNGFLSGLDGAALYGLLCEHNPRRYFEIGSGNSTRFVRRAIRDHHLQTQITSFDPWPRAEIHTVCDLAIVQPLEEVDVRIFDQLEAGDILFVDHSHRVLMNSDATMVFLDILPRLKPGILVGFHDIFLPLDYPPSLIDRYYSEQYALAAYLLAEGPRIEVELPCAFVSNDPELAPILAPLWEDLRLDETWGLSFWIRIR